jgi:hypothetical protein
MVLGESAQFALGQNIIKEKTGIWETSRAAVCIGGTRPGTS